MPDVASNENIRRLHARTAAGSLLAESQCRDDELFTIYLLNCTLPKSLYFRAKGLDCMALTLNQCGRPRPSSQRDDHLLVRRLNLLNVLFKRTKRSPPPKNTYNLKGVIYALPLRRNSIPDGEGGWFTGIISHRTKHNSGNCYFTPVYCESVISHWLTGSGSTGRLLCWNQIYPSMLYRIICGGGAVFEPYRCEKLLILSISKLCQFLIWNHSPPLETVSIDFKQSLPDFAPAVKREFGVTHMSNFKEIYYRNLNNADAQL
ncbi:hypothetical protein EVAR_57891_1 [Eumeta japonica]|uniref:Uncharacterized protein n=1 Tax=Eumeta variegata TaxID=151549 RepID=A0A4C1YUQ9_EUMVA|nr:hypothetical protein EVAR_57891_1 [Eumeta japonica]